MNKREAMRIYWSKRKLDIYSTFKDLLDLQYWDNEADYYTDLEGNTIKLFENARVLYWSYKLKGKDKFVGKRKTSELLYQFSKLGIVTKKNDLQGPL